MNKFDNKEKQYNTMLRYPKKTNNPVNKFKIVWSFIIILFIITGFLAVYLKLSNKTFSDIVASISGKEAVTNDGFINRRNAFDFFNKKKNILLLGVDVNHDGNDPFAGTRSDTIIILNIEPRSKTINVISIPRDSKVYIEEDNGVQKINAAHALGGAKLTVKTIESTFGIHIDNYVAVSNTGVKRMVDALGGIPVYVEKDMHYHDYSGKLHIDLNKGMNVLSGEQAEGYIRFRHDAMGDIARAGRQQVFLNAILTKLKSPESITKVPSILKIVSSYVKTDLSLYEMTHLVAMLRNIDDSKIEFATLPGTPSQKGYISYWILDPEKTQEILDRMVYRIHGGENQKPTSASIVYTKDNKELAEEMQKELVDEGYKVNCFMMRRLPQTQIIGHNSTISKEFVRWLKKKTPKLKNAQFIYNPQHFYCNEGDFTLLLANN